MKIKMKAYTLLLAIILFGIIITPLGHAEVNAMEESDDPIRYLGPATPTDLNTAYPAGILEEATGYRVEYNQLPTENADQRLVLEVASGTDYDLLGMSPGQYQILTDEGALLPLNDLLEKYPDVKANIKDSGWGYATLEDGNIYGVPNVDDSVFATALGYRADIFEEHGWEAPNTVDEFYELLKAIKEETDLIPLTGSEPYMSVIASGFGISYGLVVNEDGEVESWLRDPQMKEYLAFMQQIYDEGLIDVDWPVNTMDTVNQKISSGQAVMVTMSHWSPTPWINALRETTPEAEFKSIMPLEDENGDRVIAISDSVSLLFGMPQTISEERADLVMGMIDSRLQKDNYWLGNVGIEDTHYTLGEDGIPEPILPIFEEDMNDAHYYQTGRNQTEHPITWLARVQKNPIQYAAFLDMNRQAVQHDWSPDPLRFASFEALTEYAPALNVSVNDYFIAVMAGTESLDGYDSFVEEWVNSGGLELEAQATEWYQNNDALVEAALASETPYRDLFLDEAGE